MRRHMTDDQQAALRRAWVVRRNVMPITALDSNGYGYTVTTDDELARQRFDEILLSYLIEREDTLFTRRKQRQASRAGGDDDA